VFTRGQLQASSRPDAGIYAATTASVEARGVSPKPPCEEESAAVLKRGLGAGVVGVHSASRAFSGLCRKVPRTLPTALGDDEWAVREVSPPCFRVTCM
jgi:hypothetical protein